LPPRLSGSQKERAEIGVMNGRLREEVQPRTIEMPRDVGDKLKQLWQVGK
jgi:hypothetical protein